MQHECIFFGTDDFFGYNQGDHPAGWQSVAVHDPVVQDAADHAIKTIQQRSNSLVPYQLQEIVHANVEVVEESAKFDIILKVSRGDKEEKLKVEVHKSDEGAFKLIHMAPHDE
ncbi:hypothetical protein DCAR_0934275 [Daucus carota subsp. sativus]|uniref:Uncharacterized protein n=1 Tax=Daucus carota subsp. sativus TaxID=79200 RepID=A0A175YF44_DAUCS|nr:hypothetical protein DCAR_0934275 [Daucus carota subsp. sativus]